MDIYNPSHKSLAQHMRKQSVMTKAEGLVWNMILKKDMTGYRFLRQKQMGNYILDFYSQKLKLCIEIDGESHHYTTEQDDIRTRYLESLGIMVIRYRNKDVYKNLQGVKDDIMHHIATRAKEPLL